jgi:hypothetical protein
MTVLSLEHETPEQFADRFAGAWRSVVRNSLELQRESYHCAEEVLRAALAMKDSDAASELISRTRRLVGPGVNGSRLLELVDDWIVARDGKNLGCWRLLSDGGSAPDQFGYFRVVSATYDVDAKDVSEVTHDEQLSPLAELASAWLLFARARGITSASTGEMFAAVMAAEGEPFVERLGDDFLTAASRVMTPNQFENPAAAPSALSLFLGKNEAEPVEVIDTDGSTVTISFTRDQSAPKSVRRWRLEVVSAVVTPEIVEADVESAPEITAEPEPAPTAVEEDHLETTGPLLIHLLAQAQEFQTAPLVNGNDHEDA